MTLRYTAPPIGELPPVFLSSFHSLAYRGAQRTAPSSGTWTAINRIIYVPFVLPQGAMVYRYFWLNGATVGTNNFQVGVFDAAFAAVNRGTSTLSAGANVCQFDNITDYFLAPGEYYMAMYGNGVTATVFRASGSPNQPLGVYYETNAGGLPTTGAPADTGVAVSPYIAMFGLVLRATDP